MTLFEDRSRGRITLKMDPTPASTQTTTTTAPISPKGSPMMQFIQPRTSTPIRMSPPNSPESKLKNASPSGSKKNSNQEKQKGLVLAN